MSKQRFAVCIAGLVIVTVLGLLWPARVAIRAPLPQPNGYEDFIKAGAKLTNFAGDYRRLGATQLRAIVAHDAAALEQLRVGLQRECRVPLYDAKSIHLSELSTWKRLALALTAEGQLAELEGRTNEAARSYLDGIRLGHEAARGGILIDHLVGMACEAMGSGALAKIVSTLDAKECRAVIAALEAVEAKRESGEDVLQRDRAWTRRNYGVWQRMILRVQYGSSKTSEQRYRRRLQVQLAAQEQLRIDLASRAYGLEHGKPPATRNELVPDYLKSVSKR